MSNFITARTGFIVCFSLLFIGFLLYGNVIALAFVNSPVAFGLTEGGEPVQPIDMPRFEPGNVTFPNVTINTGQTIFWTGDCVQYNNANAHCELASRTNNNENYSDSRYYLVFRVLEKPSGQKQLIDEQVLDKHAHMNCTYYGGSSYTGGYSGPREYCQPKYVLPGVKLFVNESGVYNFKVMYLPISKGTYDKVGSSFDINTSYDFVSASGQIVFNGFEMYGPYQKDDFTKCANYSSTSDLNWTALGSAEYYYYQTTQRDEKCNIKYVGGNNRSNLCIPGTVTYDLAYPSGSYYYNTMCNIYKKNGSVFTPLTDASVDQEYKFEVKAGTAVLEEQLAELRASYSIQIDELTAKLGDENLTAEQFAALMDEYKVLLENKTDARLIEKLTLMRYDFTLRLKQMEEKYANDSALIASLNQQWGETIPLLELNIAALDTRIQALESQRVKLESELAALRESGASSSQILALENELASLRNALNEYDQAKAGVQLGQVPWIMRVVLPVSLLGTFVFGYLWWKKK